MTASKSYQIGRIYESAQFAKVNLLHELVGWMKGTLETIAVATDNDKQAVDRALERYHEIKAELAAIEAQRQRDTDAVLYPKEEA